MFSFVRRPERDRVGVAFTDRWGGVSDPRLGPLNMGRGEVEKPDALAENFERVRRELGYDRVVTLHQVHGRDVVCVDEQFLDGWSARHHLGPPSGMPPLPEADALVTRLPGVALCVRVADCVPVAFADVGRGIVGAAHAGRAGFADGVVPATVEAMRDLGATDIQAWIGPHVCGQCYEVPEQMRDELSVAHPAASGHTSWGTPSIDLGAGIRAQLRGENVSVTACDPCTLTSEDLHSHRRDGIAAGRLACLVWLEAPGAPTPR